MEVVLREPTRTRRSFCQTTCALARGGLPPCAQECPRCPDRFSSQARSWLFLYPTWIGDSSASTERSPRIDETMPAKKVAECAQINARLVEELRDPNEVFRSADPQRRCHEVFR